jgi:glycosyltransferase involved in cell wall biosynthesis
LPSMGVRMENELRLLLIADFRSPHALGWLDVVSTSLAYEVHAISTHYCKKPSNVHSFHVFPLDFARLKSWINRVAFLKGIFFKVTKRINVGTNPDFRFFQIFKQIEKTKPNLIKIINEIKPDVIHALRIPFEGILASEVCPENVPLVLSVWGNDFTLFGQSKKIASKISSALSKTSFLHTDSANDIFLAHQLGFGANKNSAVFAANGGLDLLKLPTDLEGKNFRQTLNVNEDHDFVISPRAVGPYINTEAFLNAIPLCLAINPKIKFILISVKGVTHLESIIDKLKIRENIILTNYISPELLRLYLKISKVMVSPSTHDGTPITLLESMGIGTFPVVGDLPSIREWIVDGKNGILINSLPADSIAHGILKSLNDVELRKAAAIENYDIVVSRASRKSLEAKVKALYYEALTSKSIKNTNVELNG